MNELQNVFNFGGADVRTIIKNNEPWFVAKDVCEVLDIQNTTQAVERLDEDERAMFNIGRQGEVNIINESGLYSLIFSSRKEEAKQFKRWVTHEVLPSIRKTGQYQLDESIKQSLMSYDPMSYITYMANLLPIDSPELTEINKQIQWHDEINKNSLQCKVGFRTHKIGYVSFEELVAQFKIPDGYWYYELKEYGYLAEIKTDDKPSKSYWHALEFRLTDKGRDIGGEEIPHMTKHKNKTGGRNYAYRFPEMKFLEIFGQATTCDDVELEEYKQIASNKIDDYNKSLDEVLCVADRYKAVRIRSRNRQ